ncbi:MAG: hypothetical protein SV239_09405, partial [Thermodesulfobacteriota bacterium]|nr:hypothetical protein [Thermodesulfobacteriota bacterium]
KGASVFALSQRGATSETARWLANSENRSDLIGGAGALSLDPATRPLYVKGSIPRRKKPTTRPMPLR